MTVHIFLTYFEGLYVVLASKAGPTTFTHYDDVCFSTGEDRAANFVAIPIMEWGLICVASANSIEVLISNVLRFHFLALKSLFQYVV